MCLAVTVRRNVSSTRWPTSTESGSTSVSSHVYRPPPSKSSTAATAGGGGGYPSRSIVYVATVAGVSDRGTGDCWSIELHRLQTRAGGRLMNPHSFHCEPTNANFHASVRCAGGP